MRQEGGSRESCRPPAAVVYLGGPSTVNSLVRGEDLSFFECGEALDIKDFVAECGGKRFDVAVLPGIPGEGEEGVDLQVHELAVATRGGRYF